VSFFSYRENLHAVADGKVLKIQDGRNDNSGKKKDARLSTADELSGNYIVIDIGNSHYAIYANCFPSSFMVKEKDSVKVGQVIALLGNSGYSSEPHLHFQISSSPEIYFSRGVPYTLKHFKKVREYPDGVLEDVEYHNAIPEENSIVSFFETQL
jgi:murein DD-endopeptidase MepM/ murein hydrolase activator NlpD